MLRWVVAMGNGLDNIKLWGQRSCLIDGLSANAGLNGRNHRRLLTRF
jgi:hypothetical protein